MERREHLPARVDADLILSIVNLGPRHIVQSASCALERRKIAQQAQQQTHGTRTAPPNQSIARARVSFFFNTSPSLLYTSALRMGESVSA